MAVNPILTLTMNSGRKIKIELYPSLAPNTVNSVIALARKRAYDGSKFYRVVKDFVLQTGCSDDEYGMYSDKMLPGEFAANGYTVAQPLFRKGIVGMCGLKPNTSDSSSFFIMTGELKNRSKDKPDLNDNYAAIGQVIAGMDEVMRINEIGTRRVDYNNIAFNQPQDDQVINSLTVETFGINYPEPEALPYPAEYLDLIKDIGQLLYSK